MKSICLLVGAVLLGGISLLHSIARAEPLGTTVSYEGQLSDSGAPANGTFDFRFILYDRDAGGSQVGEILTQPGVPVANGRFTCDLDFGASAFSGEVRWLEIAVRPAGSGGYQVLSPRRKIGSVPNAVYAAHAITAVMAAATGPNAVNSAAIQPGSVTADKVPVGELVRSVNAITDHVFLFEGEDVSIVREDATLTFHSTNHWKLGGNAGTTPSFNFIGTLDDQPLDLKVNNSRALRLEPNPGSAPNVIAGASGNTAENGAVGVTISGGANSWEGQSPVNRVGGNFGVIGGGSDNRIKADAGWSAIAGGYKNAVEPLAQAASVGGGEFNRIEFGARDATIAGGVGNVIQTNSQRATISGGGANVIETNAVNATIGGGEVNRIEFGATNATISGGQRNTVYFGNFDSTVGGGSFNSISSSTPDYRPARGYATIGGGTLNSIVNASGSTIAGGITNRIDGTEGGAPRGQGSTIGGGEGNMVTRYISTIAGGGWNTNGGVGGTIGGGTHNFITGNGHGATIPGGSHAVASHKGQWAYASGGFTNASSDVVSGSAQSSLYVLRRTTTSAAATELFLGGDSDVLYGTYYRLTVPPETTWAFEILVVARSTGVDSAGYKLQGVIRNDSGTPVFVGTPSKTVLGENNSSWDVIVDADNVNDALVLKAIGSNGVEIRWVATVRTTEVTF